MDIQQSKHLSAFQLQNYCEIVAKPADGLTKNYFSGWQFRFSRSAEAKQDRNTDTCLITIWFWNSVQTQSDAFDCMTLHFMSQPVISRIILLINVFDFISARPPSWGDKAPSHPKEVHLCQIWIWKPTVWRIKFKNPSRCVRTVIGFGFGNARFGCEGSNPHINKTPLLDIAIVRVGPANMRTIFALASENTSFGTSWSAVFPCPSWCSRPHLQKNGKESHVIISINMQSEWQRTGEVSWHAI